MGIQIASTFPLTHKASEIRTVHYQAIIRALRKIDATIYQPLIQLQQLKSRGTAGKVLKMIFSSGQCGIIKLRQLNSFDCSESQSTKNDFLKEEWICGEFGRDVPLIPTIGAGEIAFGPLGKFRYAFICSEFSPHSTAFEVCKTRKNEFELMRHVGELAQKIHRIKAKNFGCAFDSERRAFNFGSWAEMIEDIESRSDLAGFVRLTSLSCETTSRLICAIKEVRLLPSAPQLFHGDLIHNLGNVLVPTDGKGCIAIDWERAGAGAAFIFELGVSMFALFDQNLFFGYEEEIITEYLRGYGMSVYDYRVNYEKYVCAIAALIAGIRVRQCLTLSWRPSVRFIQWLSNRFQ